MEVLIEIKKLSKSYPVYESNHDRVKELLSLGKKKYHRNFFPLKDINLKFYKNEIVGIIGKNGAGKSTLLKLITGVLSPTSGEINTLGNINALIELGAGFNPEYTGLENIYFYGITKGISKKEMQKHVTQICEFAGIGDYINQPIKNYSSGMFARLAFSVSINMEPDILIVDEILSVGDVFFQQKCIQKMKELIKKGSTVLFVSHDLHAIKFFCDRVIYLENGKILRDGYNVTEIIDYYEKGSLDNNRELTIENKKDFLEVLDTHFLDKNEKVRNRFKVGESIKVVITYKINTPEEDRFLGFGMRNHNGVYVSGINTKLDGIKLPNKSGLYKAELLFDEMNLYKGVYDTWSVIYNESGTILLGNYLIPKALEIYDPNEMCEGIINLKHHWKIEEIKD